MAEISEIARWLGDRGFEKYVEVFEENEIDIEALPELTEEDFREMGVPIGPRRKLLKAIREQSAPVTESVPTSPAEAPAEADGHAATQSPVAERRQLTVMFSDLAGSNRVAIGAATHRLIENRFEFESLGRPKLS